MKKTTCCIFTLCLLLLTVCDFLPSADSRRAAELRPSATSRRAADILVNGSIFIPANAQEAQVSGFAFEEVLTLSAAQLQKFCNQVQALHVTQLTAQDALSFSNLADPEAADIAVRFGCGAALFLSGGGILSRFADANGKALAEPEHYTLSPDAQHTLYQLLIPDFEEGYEATPLAVEFIRPEDKNADEILEVPFFLPSGRELFPCEGGFLTFHSVWQKTDAESLLRIVKYDAQGSFVWARDYPDLAYQSYQLQACIPTKDGGFAFAIDSNITSCSAENAQAPPHITPGFLAKCDAKGQILWRTQVDFLGGGEIAFLCETADGALLTAGSCQDDGGARARNGDNTYGYSDLLMMKYSKDGKRLNLLQYGGSDFDSFSGASYTPEVGLVIWGSTQSCDGEITARKEKGGMLYGREFLAVLDTNFNQKWQYVFEEQEEIFTAFVTVSKDKIYLAGELSADSGKPDQTAVFRFNAAGRITKSCILDLDSVCGLSAVADGSLLLAANPSAYAAISATAQVFRLSNALEITQTILDVPGDALYFQVISTADNGFFTLQQQPVKTIAVPAYVSYRPTLNASILSRYDAQGTLLLRKTYDKNLEITSETAVTPLPNGRVLVGK